jgi:hypothetical protein
MSFQRHILKRYIVPTFDLSGLAGDTIADATEVVVVNGGEGFAVGDIVEIAGGTAGDLGAVEVATVDATNGAILTVQDVTAGVIAGAGYTASVEEAGSILTSADTFVNEEDFYTFDFYQLSQPQIESGTSTYSPAIDAATLNIGTHVGGAGANWLDPDNTGQRFADNIPTVLVVRKGDQPQLRVQKTWIDGGTIEVFAEPGYVDRNGNLVGQELRAEDLVDEFRCVEANKIWDTATSIEQITGAATKEYGFCREPLSAEVGATTLFAATGDADCPVGSYWDGGTGCTDYLLSEINDGTAQTNEEAIGRYDAQQLCLASGNHFESMGAFGATMTYDVATLVASNGVITGGTGYSVGDVVVVGDDAGVTFTVTEVAGYTVTNDTRGGVIVSGTLTGTVSTKGDGAQTGTAADARCIDATTADNFSLANFNYPMQSGAVDYARTTCKQYGHQWVSIDSSGTPVYTCVAWADPTGFTQDQCTDGGHVWIAGTCYDGAEFGDGMNRDSSFQQDPTQKPN